MIDELFKQAASDISEKRQMDDVSPAIIELTGLAIDLDNPLQAKQCLSALMDLIESNKVSWLESEKIAWNLGVAMKRVRLIPNAGDRSLQTQIEATLAVLFHACHESVGGDAVKLLAQLMLKAERGLERDKAFF